MRSSQNRLKIGGQQRSHDQLNGPLEREKFFALVGTRAFEDRPADWLEDHRPNGAVTHLRQRSWVVELVRCPAPQQTPSSGTSTAHSTRRSMPGSEV